MNINKPLKFFLCCGALYYTAISTLIMIINAALLSQDSTKVIVPEQFLYLLLFCYMMSLGSTLRRIDAIPRGLGWVLNAICYVVGFLVFLLCSKMSFTSALILDAAFLIIYAIVAISVSFIQRRSKASKSTVIASARQSSTPKTKKSNKSKDNESYTSMFS
jgi:uncharacterized protein YacL